MVQGQSNEPCDSSEDVFFISKEALTNTINRFGPFLVKKVLESLRDSNSSSVATALITRTTKGHDLDGISQQIFESLFADSPIVMNKILHLVTKFNARRYTKESTF